MERRERTGERREERRGEERRGEEKGDEREEIGGETGERMAPDLSLLIGFARGVLLSLRCTCRVSAFGFVDLIRLSSSEPLRL